MKHLVETLLGVLVLFLALHGSDESQPYSWASHVCSYAWYQTTYTSYQTYRTRYQDYYTSCGLWGWSRCKRRRSLRDYYYSLRTTSVRIVGYVCCSGWRQSGRYCSIPICSSGCVHGRCTSPGTCTCNRGWKGSRCQYDVNECSRSLHGCSHICINTRGSYRCSCREGLVVYGSGQCKDKDECATNNGQCDHICINSYGSYKCRCFLGFKQHSDGRRCIASNEFDFPASLLPQPTVTYRNGSWSKVEMVCSFDFPLWSNVSYLVDWYANSIKPVYNDTWCNPEQPGNDQNDCNRRKSVITLSEHFVIGDTVWCKLYMKFSTSSKNNWTEIGIESNQFYVGIEVTPRHHIVEDCITNRMKNTTVTLRPTVPILPFMNITGTDSVVVSVLVPENQPQISVDKCSVELKTENIIHGKTITISGICGKANHTLITHFFHFKPETSSPDWFSGIYQMPSMQVAVHPRKLPFDICSYIKPSLDLISVVDKRIVNILNGSHGYFVMYSNEAKNVQVQARVLSKHNLCGVAIREGKDVLVLSICNELLAQDIYPTKPKDSNLKVIKRSPGSLSKGTWLFKISKLKQAVLLSSGLLIAVYRKPNAGRLLAAIIAPTTDNRKVSGLCSNFIGDEDDDFKELRLELKPYSNFSIPEEKSYFQALPPQEEEEEENDHQEKFCFCSIKNKIQKNEDCQTTKTHFAKIDNNEKRLMARMSKKANEWFGGPSDCAQNEQASFCKN